VRKSRYDLGKKFFTNITPGYQLYPTVLLLPWTDPDAPGERGCKTRNGMRPSQAGPMAAACAAEGLVGPAGLLRNYKRVVFDGFRSAVGPQSVFVNMAGKSP
jgi:hypothetical protein